MKFRKVLLVAIVGWLIAVGIHHTYKELPSGVSFTGQEHEVSAQAVKVLTDRTFINETGEYQSEQEIFTEIGRMIEVAEKYILIDMFLFNDFLGTATTSYRAISSELVTALVEKKIATPDIVIQVITDPINIIYGGHNSTQLHKLEEAGVEVIITDLTKLRDSNLLYSAVWRTFGQWWGNSDRPGYLPNPFAENGQKLGARTYLSLLNFKANHRKVVLADYTRGDEVGLATLITSANPHDGSSRHSNFSVRIDEKIWSDVLKTEAAVAEFSARDFIAPTSEIGADNSVQVGETLQVQLLTEKKIKDTLINEIGQLDTGHTLDIAMFYLADREIIKAFKEADERGVQVRLLLDPNKDAFGREKGGMPNRQVAHELVTGSNGNTEVRWCATHGEQCHSKLVFIKKGSESILIQGSANLTRRNLDDFNLEINVLIKGNQETDVFAETEAFFATQWNNQDGNLYSHPYQEYDDDSMVKTIQYRFMEWSGLSSW
jgi:HKD family nuclease